jgi:hypothetical protein
MFVRFLWLLPLIVVLATVLGGGTALAHRCHEISPTMAAAPVAQSTHQSDLPIGASARFAEPLSAVGAPEHTGHDAPCHCPDGRGDCHGHCLAMTAAVIAVAEMPVLDFFPGRLRVAFGDAENAPRWTPTTDIDPPRPSA